MIRLRRFFCASQSVFSEEQIFGTVARIDSWLLLEYPGVWRRDAIDGSKLAVEVKSQLQRIAESYPRHRQLLIRQDHRSVSTPRCFIVQSCESSPRITQIQLDGYAQLLELRLDELENHPAAKIVNQPLYAVCTHGNHDKCCAKFGLPVFSSIHARVGDYAWQCSHVGGDRFAANVVVFPYGIYYGHLTPIEIPALVRSTSRGEVHLENYRGRCCHPRAAQIADYFLREHSGRMKIGEFRLLSTERLDEEARRVRFEAVSDETKHTVVLRARADALEGFLTCDEKEKSPITQYEMVSYSVEEG